MAKEKENEQKHERFLNLWFKKSSVGLGDVPGIKPPKAMPMKPYRPRQLQANGNDVKAIYNRFKASRTSISMRDVEKGKLEC